MSVSHAESRVHTGPRARTHSSPTDRRIVPSQVVVAQAVGVVVACIVALAGAPWWAALACWLVLTAVQLVRVRGWSLLDWLATGYRYLTRPGYQPPQVVDFQAGTGQSVGLCWSGTGVVAVVEVLPPVGSLTQITRDGFVSTHLLPTDAIVSCLHQHDITLSGIDIISHGYRAASGTPATEVYERLIGPLPATATRMVWLALRLDASDNAEAVASRGGGAEGTARAVTVAATRLVRALADAGCRSRILTAAEVETAALHVSRGVDPTTLTQTWKHAPLPGVCNTGYSIEPRALGKDLLAKLWAPASLGTTVTVRLRPGADPGTVLVGAASRSTSRTLPEPLREPGLVSMSGRHRDALLANLPLAVPELESVMPLGTVEAHRVSSLGLVPAGCGQLIGSDDHGNGIAARIAGPGVSSVYVAGELYLAQQLVFRAVATGARVLIHTDRPEAWASLIDSIATPDRLRIAGVHPQSENMFNTVVFDGVSALPPRAGVTGIYLYADPSQWPSAAPDLSIVQPDAIGDRITLSTGGSSIGLMLVTISSETAFIGHPRSLDDEYADYQY
ncbi:type VII secretion protein EccE [Rhodococcus sp. HNM0569]|uniref:type VII secretion protein EccE n=1 Tax=Rhodococcus sp. HNM0569 TaxID=2716340 RepID=UPI00146E423B|nr:type VII secretion protein EccE [Rhodococcus sp. HNM0569]NLU81758.1 type VII secretion protein EccE [Rhodococcus sp. HNM0569]